MKRIVVLGTGTGVGKTAVSVALLQGLVATGRSALGLKPIESGVSPERPSDTDAARLGDAARHPPRCLFALRDALSPHLAAERDGRVIHVSDVLAWIAAQERAVTADTWSLIETAGGLCSPLSLSTSNLDLVIGAGSVDLVLVAPNRLGVLHDVLACVALLRHAALAPPLIVLTEAAGRDPSSSTNARELRRITRHSVREYTPAIPPDQVLSWFGAVSAPQGPTAARRSG